MGKRRRQGQAARAGGKGRAARRGRTGVTPPAAASGGRRRGTIRPRSDDGRADAVAPGTLSPDQGLETDARRGRRTCPEGLGRLRHVTAVERAGRRIDPGEPHRSIVQQVFAQHEQVGSPVRTFEAVRRQLERGNARHEEHDVGGVGFGREDPGRIDRDELFGRRRAQGDGPIAKPQPLEDRHRKSPELTAPSLRAVPGDHHDHRQAHAQDRAADTHRLPQGRAPDPVDREDHRDRDRPDDAGPHRGHRLGAVVQRRPIVDDARDGVRKNRQPPTRRDLPIPHLDGDGIRFQSRRIADPARSRCIDPSDRTWRVQRDDAVSERRRHPPASRASPRNDDDQKLLDLSLRNPRVTAGPDFWSA